MHLYKRTDRFTLISITRTLLHRADAARGPVRFAEAPHARRSGLVAAWFGGEGRGEADLRGEHGEDARAAPQVQHHLALRAPAWRHR